MDSSHSTTESTLGVPMPRGWRILVIDDYRDSAEALKFLLQLSGNECFAAYSGTEGIHLARFHRPEIILLDLNMPEMDGFKTYELIRAEHWSKHVKVIAITGVPERKNQKRVQEMKLDGFLTKPVDPEELAVLLQSIGRGEPELH